MRETTFHACRDCRADPPATVRKLAVKKDGTPVAGPRCTTHHRLFTRASKLRSKVTRTKKNFTITAEQYDRLYDQQGGRCAAVGCDATGATKRLAVDHDHRCCPGATSCGLCVRGLLCGRHNREIGWNRDKQTGWDSPEYYEGVATYLRNPPANWMLARVQDAEGVWQWAYDLGERPAVGQVQAEVEKIAAINRIPKQRTPRAE